MKLLKFILIGLLGIYLIGASLLKRKIILEDITFQKQYSSLAGIKKYCQKNIVKEENTDDDSIAASTPAS